MLFLTSGFSLTIETAASGATTKTIMRDDVTVVDKKDLLGVWYTDEDRTSVVLV
jgi:hypothetical protein